MGMVLDVAWEMASTPARVKLVEELEKDDMEDDELIELFEEGLIEYITDVSEMFDKPNQTHDDLEQFVYEVSARIEELDELGNTKREN